MVSAHDRKQNPSDSRTPGFLFSAAPFNTAERRRMVNEPFRMIQRLFSHGSLCDGKVPHQGCFLTMESVCTHPQFF
jgi:hypothetical protein